MKQALCVKAYDELSNLVHKNIDHVEAYMVDREICEKTENGYMQIIPYVTFYALDAMAGKLMFIQYQRKTEGAGEERLAGATSIGFGGHIDQEDEIASEEIIHNEDGTTSYKMTLDNILKTGIACGVREVSEEIGLDIEELTSNIDHGNTAFFTGDPSEEVNRVHVGLSIQIELTPSHFEELKSKCVINEEEIEKLDVLGLNLDVIVEEMDLSFTINKITENLSSNHGLEDWSCRIFNYLTRGVINRLFYNVTYQDMVRIAITKQSQEQQVDSITEVPAAEEEVV